MAEITKKICKRVPYVGPVVSATCLVFDVKEIVQDATPLGASKIIVSRFIKECTPPELFIAGKCLILTGGIIATLATSGNPLIVSTTINAARSIVKDL